MEAQKVDVEFREQAVAEDNIREHGISIYDAIMLHKRICWWTFFFAMSAVGWYYLPSQPQSFRHTNCFYRGFDAQVNGTMLSVPQFRADFG
jgi:hypothetical protein